MKKKTAKNASVTASVPCVSMTEHLVAGVTTEPVPAAEAKEQSSAAERFADFPEIPAFLRRKKWTFES